MVSADINTSPSISSTPTPESNNKDNSEDLNIPLAVILATEVVLAVVVLLVLILTVCATIKVLKKKKLMIRKRQNDLENINNNLLQPTGLRSDSGLENINSNMLQPTDSGSHAERSTVMCSSCSCSRLGGRSNIPPTAETMYSYSPGAVPSNLPTSPRTVRESYVMGETCSQLFSEIDGCRAPNPSVNYDAMSGVSTSVSQRIPSTAGAWDYGYPRYTLGRNQKTNPLHHLERYRLPSSLVYPYLSQLSYPSPHIWNYDDMREILTETESTVSMTTANTENCDVFHYDDARPPGRPPSLATEVSGNSNPISPNSSISLEL